VSTNKDSQQVLLHHARSALTLYQAGKPDEALEAASAVLAINPDSSSALSIQGAAYMAIGNPAAALPPLIKLAALHPGNADAQFNIVIAAKAVGRWDDALCYLDRSLQIREDFAAARFERGWLRMMRQDYHGAADDIERAKGAQGVPEQSGELAEIARIFAGLTTASAGPAVTVVVPCFNYGQYVEEAVASALAQTYPRLDVVLVEGGSTDGITPAIVESLAGPRVRIVRRDRPCPVGDNRNAGISAADGELICCLDADDRLRPDFIAKAVAVHTDLGYDIIGSSVAEFGEGRRRRVFASHPTLDDLKQTNQFSVAALFHRMMWEKAGRFRDVTIPEGQLHEDWEFWLRLFACGARGFNINWEFLIEYRTHSSGNRQSQRPGLLPTVRQAAAMLELNQSLLNPQKL
jgi:hypothetical protein